MIWQKINELLEQLREKSFDREIRMIHFVLLFLVTIKVKGNNCKDFEVILLGDANNYFCLDFVVVGVDT